MDTEKMARFISELRKSKNLTQKELAEQLGVTDKAVSKWERGLSCPDIALLSPLSDILGVTTSELLQGESTVTIEEGSPAPVVEALVETALDYADTASKNKLRDLYKMLAIIFSAALLLGNVVCVICNFAINGTLTWALFPISASLFLWPVMLPVLLMQKKGVFISLILFSLLLIPFLFALEKIIGIPSLIMPMGTRISIISLCYLWIIAVLYAKTRLNPFMTTALVLLIGIPVSVWINRVVADYTGQVGTDVWDILAYSIMLILSLSLFVRCYLKKEPERTLLRNKKHR